MRRKYWYFVEIEECPCCFAHNIYRERRYTRRPRDKRKRMRFKQVWCGQQCQG